LYDNIQCAVTTICSFSDIHTTSQPLKRPYIAQEQCSQVQQALWNPNPT
jgi:hypothetical protein